jgi:hypothetical protein
MKHGGERQVSVDGLWKMASIWGSHERRLRLLRVPSGRLSLRLNRQVAQEFPDRPSFVLLNPDPNQLSVDAVALSPYNHAECAAA